MLSFPFSCVHSFILFFFFYDFLSSTKSLLLFQSSFFFLLFLLLLHYSQAKIPTSVTQQPKSKNKQIEGVKRTNYLVVLESVQWSWIVPVSIPLVSFVLWFYRKACNGFRIPSLLYSDLVVEIDGWWRNSDSWLLVWFTIWIDFCRYLDSDCKFDCVRWGLCLNHVWIDGLWVSSVWICVVRLVELLPWLCDVAGFLWSWNWLGIFMFVRVIAGLWVVGFLWISASLCVDEFWPPFGCAVVCLIYSEGF